MPARHQKHGTGRANPHPSYFFLFIRSPSRSTLTTSSKQVTCNLHFHHGKNYQNKKNPTNSNAVHIQHEATIVTWFRNCLQSTSRWKHPSIEAAPPPTNQSLSERSSIVGVYRDQTKRRSHRPPLRSRTTPTRPPSKMFPATNLLTTWIINQSISTPLSAGSNPPS